MSLDAPALIDALKNAWKEPNAGRRTSWGTMQPLGPRHDRTGWDNPLWDIVRWMPWTFDRYGKGRGWEMDIGVHYVFAPETVARLIALGADRHHLVRTYSWAIPTTYDIEWMVRHLDGRKVVESGAGSGYWAWQLAQAKVEVAAYDPWPVGPDNRFITQQYWMVRSHDASCVTMHPNRALLITWPRYGEADAYEALSMFEGDMFFYAGEPEGMATGDDAFFDLLDREWKCVDVAPYHATFGAIHCNLELYRRR